MTLEALASSALPAFVVYDTISAYPLPTNGAAGSVGQCRAAAAGGFGQDPKPGDGAPARRKRRRRKRSCKDEADAENQRMTHIAVERNRRRLMNKHLAVLRSLMPDSHVQRGDQASIVGGAIDFVKELQQHLQSLEVQKRKLQQQKIEAEPPFSHFFAYPQYCWRHTLHEHMPDPLLATAVADIEVAVIESHANLRILTPRRPRQHLKMVAGLQALRFSILHLNVTTLDSMALYSVSMKVEEGCSLTTVDDIAAAVHHMLSLFQSETAATCLV